MGEDANGFLENRTDEAGTRQWKWTAVVPALPPFRFGGSRAGQDQSWTIA